MKNRLMTIAIFAVITSFVLAACGGAQPTETSPESVATPVIADSTIIAEGRVEPVRYVNIAFTAGGVVGEVLVNEGDLLSAGDVIARLSNADTLTLNEAQTDAFQRMVEAYEAVRLAQLDVDNFDLYSELRAMTPQEAVQSTYEKLEKARADYEPYKFLNSRNDEKKALDDAWAKYRAAITWTERVSALNNAKSQLESAQHDYDALQDTADLEKLAGTRALLANGELRSPFNGTIAELDIKAGEPAVTGQSAVTVADFSSWVIKTTDLTEIDVVNIKEGQSAVVVLDALPDSSFEATVQSISQTFDEVQGDVVYEVTLLLTSADPAIRWGMTAEVKFAK